jgi:polyhydroxybutyrate depolymerase
MIRPLMCLAPAILLAGCAAKAPGSASAVSETIVVGGIERSYVVHVPPRLTTPRPLLVALHGGGGSGRHMSERYGLGLDRLADREGLIAVFPDAVERNWNDGRGGAPYRAHRENLDDVAFIRALVARIGARHAIDHRRIYVTGVSNGGMMSLRLVCEAADLIAAAAVVVASMPADLGSRCRPSRPVPVLMINGTEDELMPYDGGDVRFLRRRLGRVWSTPRTTAFLAERNGCASPPARRDRRDVDPGDGTRVSEEIHRECRDGGEVALLRIDGGGHGWPGATLRRPRWLVGRISRDIDATDEVWRFLRRHHR